MQVVALVVLLLLFRSVASSSPVCLPNSTALEKTVCLIHGSSAPGGECATKIHLPNWTVCLDDLYDDDGRCLVYSIGIANEWMFDVNMAMMGCEVHMFDPTVNLLNFNLPKAFFHHWGLYGGKLEQSSAVKYSSPQYGNIQGEMKTLLEVRALLGHENRTISILKIDCEGCEWEVFGRMGNPSQLANIKQFLIEFHFADTFGIKDASSLELVGNTFDVLWPRPSQTGAPGAARLEQFYMHLNGGIRRDRNVISELKLAGLPFYCCNEQGFVRRARAVDSRVDSSGGVSSGSTEHSEPKTNSKFIKSKFKPSASALNSLSERERAAANLARAKATFAASTEGMLVGHDKAIYLVSNGTRHSFDSLKSFLSYGYDLEKTAIAKQMAVRSLLDAGLDCCNYNNNKAPATCFNCTVLAGSLASPLYAFLHNKTTNLG